MKVKLAKSLIENEEGTNHLLIEIPSSVSFSTNPVQITLYLPNGISRSKNLNGFYEDESGTIFINSFSQTLQLVIEIFTQDPVPCSKGTICVDLNYKDKQEQTKKINHYIPISIVHEDEMDQLVIDNEVIDLVKKLHKGYIFAEDIEESEFIMVTPKIQNLDSQVSELEKNTELIFDIRYEVEEINMNLIPYRTY